MYELMGRAHAALIRGSGAGDGRVRGPDPADRRGARGRRGRGAKAGGDGIAKTIVDKLKAAIDGVAAPKTDEAARRRRVRRCGRPATGVQDPHAGATKRPARGPTRRPRRGSGARARLAAWRRRVPPSAPDALRRRPVGVFDSGVGGLTVLHELLVQLPHEDFVYFADSARVPYGPRPREEIEAFSLEVAEELLARRIKLLVVACNSASSAALPALRERLMQTTLGVDVLGVVQPGAVQAVAATRNGRVGYMATEATVNSGAYEEAIAAADPFVTVTGVACPGLVPLIERGSPFDARSSTRCATTPARCGRGGGHGDPRLYALSADRPDAPADARPRRADRQLRRADRAAGRARARQPRARQPARRGGRLPLPQLGRPRRSARPARASCSCRSARWSTSRCSRSRMTRRERSDGRAADELRPVTIEPGFVRTATGSALITLRRHARHLHRIASRSPCRGGWRQGPRVADRGVRDAARVHRRAQAARRPKGRPDGRRSRSSA